ncbi:MAG: glycosyltransferase family 39 protein [Armatimonadetes bacterium]|nr:glycosyltransferase family 39 protein [Armatimonadota bacterium]
MAKKKHQRAAEQPKARRGFLDEKNLEYLTVALVLIAASLMILLNLGNQYLWQDEAQTACIAKTILTHVIPLGSDGTNTFTQEYGAEYGKDFVWRWHTWLSFYVLALFFKLFGTSNFVCRLPFALFGIGSVLMGYYLGKALWGTRRAAVLTVALLLLSVPFLLLLRQCRSYSMAIFFSMWGLYAYLQLLERRKYAGVAFALAAILLFQSYHIYYGALVAAVIVHAALFHRDRLRTVLLVSIITALINLPWIIWLAGAKFSASLSYKAKAAVLKRHHVSQLSWFGRVFLMLGYRHIFPIPLLSVPMLVTGFNWIKGRRFPRPEARMWNRVTLLVLFIAINLLAVTMLSPYPLFRYLAPIIPACWLLAALMLERAMRVHWSIGIVVLALLAFMGTTADYFYEITHDYDGPVEGTVKYLRAHAREGDIVVCSHEEMPLKFYTNLRVIGGLNLEDLSPALNAKWVAWRTNCAWTDRRTVMFMQKNVPMSKYRAIVLQGYPDIVFENREEPGRHLFRTATNAKPVLIYERVQD